MTITHFRNGVKQMNRRKIVCDALNHKPTTPIPYNIGFTEQSLNKLIQATGDTMIEEKLGNYIHYTYFWGWPTEMPEKPEHYIDSFGVEWNRSGADKDIGVVDHPQIEDLESSGYRFPVPDIGRLRREITQSLAKKEDQFAIVGFGFCMFERSWTLMSMENVLMSMIACPEELEALYDKICDHYMPQLDAILEYDIDAVLFGDDWGQQQGLIMGPDHWRRFIKPRMARLYDRVKSAGKYVMQHSCGDCREIFPDLIEIGLDCYQTFQPEIYDIALMKRLYGSKLTFWGGISTQQCLPQMTPEQLKAEIIRVVTLLREDGGLIIAPTHSMPFDIPVENILAMIDVFQNQERYF